LRLFTAGLLLGAALTVVLGYTLRGRLKPDAAGRILATVSPSRLGEDELPAFARLSLATGARELALQVPVPAQLDRALPARLVVLMPAGEALIEQSLAAHDLRGGTLLVLLRAVVPLPAGVYRVRFEQAELPAPHESRFELFAAD
jgi:hypothetical protein